MPRDGGCMDGRLMSTLDILIGVLTAIGMYFAWRNLLYKEEQYTLIGWLCLAACVSLTVSVGQFLINT